MKRHKASAYLLAFAVAGCTAIEPKTCGDDTWPQVLERPDDPHLRERLTGHIRAAFDHERNVKNAPDALHQAAGYVASQLDHTALTVERHSFDAPQEGGGPPMVLVENIEAVKSGENEALGALVIGAHYDSAQETHGANDNGSGAAALLELARWASVRRFQRTLRFVFFVNEEEPYFLEDARTRDAMGSRRYVAKLKKAGTPVEAMISLETLAYYTRAPSSQCLAFSEWSGRHDSGPRYYFKSGDDPMPRVRCVADTLKQFMFGSALDRGDFVAFVGATANRPLVDRAMASFCSGIPGVRAAAVVMPGLMPGITWSDHRSFIEAGIPAIMVTDTAPDRYPYYHWPEDKLENLERAGLEPYVRVVQGLKRVIAQLAVETP